MSPPVAELSSAPSIPGTPSTSLPSYTPQPPVSPEPEDKISYTPVPPPDQKIPVDNQGEEKAKQKPIVYEDYPEVVPQSQPESSIKPHDVPADNQNLPSPVTSMASPVDINRDWTQTPGFQPIPTPAYQATQTPPPFLQQQNTGYQNTGYQNTSYQNTGYENTGYHNPPQMLADTSAANASATTNTPGTHLSGTVTPLNLLGDQPDKIDCPFCQKRTETKVTKHASKKTHITATILLFTTFFGVLGPYLCHCYSDVGQYCKNCGRKVTWRANGATENEVFGTPEHLRQASKYQEAPQKAK